MVGGSYGGYVALVAAFKTPERIRCAVSFAGVTDLADLKQHTARYDLGVLTLATLFKLLHVMKLRGPMSWFFSTFARVTRIVTSCSMS